MNQGLTPRSGFVLPQRRDTCVLDGSWFLPQAQGVSGLPSQSRLPAFVRQTAEDPEGCLEAGFESEAEELRSYSVVAPTLVPPTQWDVQKIAMVLVVDVLSAFVPTYFLCLLQPLESEGVSLEP